MLAVLRFLISAGVRSSPVVDGEMEVVGRSVAEDIVGCAFGEAVVGGGLRSLVYSAVLWWCVDCVGGRWFLVSLRAEDGEERYTGPETLDSYAKQTISQRYSSLPLRKRTVGGCTLE